MRIASRFMITLSTLAVLASPSQAQAIAGTYRLNDLPGLRHAVEKEPGNAGLRLRLTQALLRMDKESSHPEKARERLSEAQGQFKKILDINPELIVPLRVITLEHYMNQEFEQAVAVGVRLIKLAPEEMEVTKTVLKSLVRLKRFDEAARRFVAWLETGTTPSFGSVTGLLSIMVVYPDFRSALESEFAAALERHPGSVDLHLFQSIFFVETGRSESAWKAFHKAESLGLCDTRTGARHAYARMLASRASEFTDAPGGLLSTDLEEVARHRKGHPNHAGIAMRHARMLDIAGRRDDALAAYREVSRMNPGYWPSRYRTAKLLFDMEEHAKAAEEFAAAGKLFPFHRPCKLMECECRVKAGDADGAIKVMLGGAPGYEPGPGTAFLLKLMAEKGSLDKFIKALRATPGGANQPYIQAHLALALKASTKVTEAKAIALQAERAGLSGRDGYPSGILYDVFGEERPAALGGGSTKSK